MSNDMWNRVQTLENNITSILPWVIWPSVVCYSLVYTCGVLGLLYALLGLNVLWLSAAVARNINKQGK